MDVTSIEEWKNNRYKVCLSNGADFVLYYKELSTYQIAEGEDLSEETYARILEEILVPRATKRAMHLLEQMDRSEKQLRGKLAENGYPQEAVDAAISYVASYHYLDDERLARSFIRYHQEGRSRRRMAQDLARKGISADIIERCMEEELRQSQTQLMISLMRKRHFDPDIATREEQAKMYRFLLQRGFPPAEISRVIRGCDWDSDA